MNPLRRARFRAEHVWSSSREGTKRTASWVRDGVSGNARKLRDAVSRSGEAKPAPDGGGAKAGDAGATGLWERIGGASAWDRARADRRIAIAWVAGALLFVAWIAWTVHVWSENGSAAGIGVLVSWPAVLAALALVAALLMGAVMLVRRLAPDREPALAGGVPAELEPDAEEEAEEEAAGSDDEESEDEPDDGEKPEAA